MTSCTSAIWNNLDVLAYVLVELITGSTDDDLHRLGEWAKSHPESVRNGHSTMCESGAHVAPGYVSCGDMPS